MKEPTEKLQLGETIGQAYSGWVRHFADVMRAALLWIVLLCVMMGTADWLKWSFSVLAVESFKGGVLEYPGFGVYAAVALYAMTAILFIVAIIDIAVTWHRRVILGEVPSLIGGNLGKNFWWRYVSKLLILIAAVGGPIAIFIVVAELDDDTVDSDTSDAIELDFEGLLAAGVALLILLAALAIFARLSLVLPSSATRAASLTFKQSWRLTRGNTLRLTLGLIVCAILPGGAVNALPSLFGLIDTKMSAAEMLALKVVPDGMILGAIGRQIALICELLTLPIGVGFLSHCYQQIIQER